MPTKINDHRFTIRPRHRLRRQTSYRRLSFKPVQDRPRLAQPEAQSERITLGAAMITPTPPDN